YCKPSQTEDKQAAAITRFTEILRGYCDHTCSCIFVTKASKGETDGIDNIKKAVKSLASTTQKPHFVFLAYASQIAPDDARRHELETNSTGITSERDFDDALMRTLLVKLKTIDSRKTVTLLTCDKFDEYIPFSLIGFSMIINIPDKSSVVVFSDARRTPAYRPFEIGNSYLQLIVENKTVAFTKEGVTVVGSIPRSGEKDVELLSYSSRSAPPDPRVPPATAVKATDSVSTSVPPTPAPVSTSAPPPAPAPAPVPLYKVNDIVYYDVTDMKLIFKSGWVECKVIQVISTMTNGYQYDVQILNYIPEQVKTNVPESKLMKERLLKSSFSLTTQQQPPYSLYDMPSDPKKPKCRFGSACRY
ncbi:hypothetical protein EB001_27590, partial [bacterium]|nr:hypothetical protein [bacterium]